MPCHLNVTVKKAPAEVSPKRQIHIHPLDTFNNHSECKVFKVKNNMVGKRRERERRIRKKRHAKQNHGSYHRIISNGWMDGWIGVERRGGFPSVLLAPMLYWPSAAYTCVMLMFFSLISDDSLVSPFHHRRAMQCLYA